MKTSRYLLLLLLAAFINPAFAASFQQVTSIHFNTSSAVVNAYNKKLLNDVATILKRNPGDKIMLVGNTDATTDKADPDFNKKLAARRVNSIKSYLVQHHSITSNSVQTHDFTNTPELCNSPANSILARRVDILYCTSDAHCQSSFSAYSDWLANNCKASSGILHFDRANYNSPFSVSLSYMMPVSVGALPSTKNGVMAYGNTNSSMGDFNLKKISATNLIDLNIAMRVLSDKNSSWFNALYAGIEFWGNTSAMTAKGEFTATDFLPADHYSYQYAISSQNIGVMAKLDVFAYGRFQPYFILGFGSAQVNTSKFEMTPIGDSDVSNFTYEGKKKNNWYYKVALGLDYSLNNHIKVGTNYFYSDLGKYSTGNGQQTPLISPALQKHLSISGIAFSVAYNF